MEQPMQAVLPTSDAPELSPEAQETGLNTIGGTTPAHYEHTSIITKPIGAGFKWKSQIIPFGLLILLLIIAVLSTTTDSFLKSTQDTDVATTATSSASLETAATSVSATLPTAAPTTAPTSTPLPVPQATPSLPSLVSGYLYKDDNKNSIRESDEKPLNGVITFYRIIGDTTQFVKSIVATDGKYSLSLTQGKYSILPGAATFYLQPHAQVITIDGSGKPHTYDYAYKPTSSEGGLKLYVFNDKNENTNRDNGEELIHYQVVQITNMQTGVAQKYAVSEDGMEVSYLDFGRYFVVAYPENDSWEHYYKVTDAGRYVDVDSSGSQKIYIGVKKL